MMVRFLTVSIANHRFSSIGAYPSIRALYSDPFQLRDACTLSLLGYSLESIPLLLYSQQESYPRPIHASGSLNCRFCSGGKALMMVGVKVRLDRRFDSRIHL